METDLQTVTTNLVHLRDWTEVPWWRSAVVCDLPGSLDNEALNRVQDFLPKLAEQGFQAVLLRPANPRVELALPSLPQFVEDAHQHGLKVIVRAFLSEDEAELLPTQSPPILNLEHDGEELRQHAQAILATGADGVDLGFVNDRAGSTDSAANARAFTREVQAQLAEIEVRGDETILCAAVHSEPRESALHHITEEWFHHLRDDSLVSAPWSVPELQRRIRQVYTDRDPLGHTAAWRYSLPKWTSSPLIRSSADYGWAVADDSRDREMAMMLFTLSLPGAVYLPFLHVGGSAKAARSKTPEIKFSFEKGRKAKRGAEIAGEGLYLRNALGMGDATLAFVEGLDWATPDVSVHLTGTVMVVLNAGSSAVTVPGSQRPIVSSSGPLHTSERGTTVPPSSCVWLQTSPLEPVDPIHR